jgi:hypothetical protein
MPTFLANAHSRTAPRPIRRCMAMILWLLGCMVGAPINAADELNAADERPNVLFLFMDDQQADTIAALGNGILKTPNLDRLVADGTSFDRVRC